MGSFVGLSNISYRTKDYFESEEISKGAASMSDSELDSALRRRELFDQPSN